MAKRMKGEPAPVEQEAVGDSKPTEESDSEAAPKADKPKTRRAANKQAVTDITAPPEEPAKPVVNEKKSRQERAEEAHQLAVMANEEKEYIRTSIGDDWMYVRHHKEVYSWYFWTGTHWEAQEKEDFETNLREFVQDALLNKKKEHKLICSNDIRNFYSSHSSPARIALCKDLLRKKHWYIQQRNEFAALNLHKGINFLNGYYSLEKNALVGREKNPNTVFLDSVVPSDYKPDDIPSSKTILLIYAMLGFNKKAMWSLKTAIFRAMVPDVEQQTGVMLWGPKSVGKSSLCTILRTLAGGEQSVGSLTTNDFKSNFMTANLAGKKLTTFSEVEYLSSEANRQLKMLLGRDTVATQVKFIQRKIHFCYWGTLIATSNIPPSQLLEDSAVRSRFLAIELKKYTKSSDKSILDRMMQNLTGLINWSLQLSQNELDLIIRADDFNSGLGVDDSPIVRFIMENLVFEKNSYISKDALVKQFNAHREELGYSKGGLCPPIGSERLCTDIKQFAQDIWGKNIGELQRESRPWFLTEEDTRDFVENDNSLSLDDKRNLLRSDFCLPLIPCKAKKGKRISVIAGMRAKRDSDEKLTIDSSFDSSSDQKFNVDPLSYKVGTPQSEKWADLKREVEEELPLYKKKTLDLMDYVDPWIE